MKAKHQIEKMSFAEYVEIANRLKDIRETFHQYHPQLPKKSAHWKVWWKVDKEIDNLRSHLEELMFLDCPEQVHTLKSEEEPLRSSYSWATYIFFDCSKRVNAEKKLIFAKPSNMSRTYNEKKGFIGSPEVRAEWRRRQQEY